MLTFMLIDSNKYVMLIIIRIILWRDCLRYYLCLSLVLSPSRLVPGIIVYRRMAFGFDKLICSCSCCRLANIWRNHIFNKLGLLSHHLNTVIFTKEYRYLHNLVNSLSPFLPALAPLPCFDPQSVALSILWLFQQL